MAQHDKKKEDEVDCGVDAPESEECSDKPIEAVNISHDDAAYEGHVKAKHAKLQDIPSPAIPHQSLPVHDNESDNSFDENSTGIDHAEWAELDPTDNARKSNTSSKLRAIKRFFLHRHRLAYIGGGLAVLIVVCVTLGNFANSNMTEPETATPTDTAQTTDDQSTQEDAESEEDDEEETYAEVADMSLLPDGVDDDLAESLESLAASDGRVAHIINTIATVLPDSEATKLLTLAVDDSASIDFLAGLADNYPQDSGEPYDEEVQKGTIPLLLQWDERWGYTVYCNESFAAAGCGPTALAMVYMGLTGNADKTPYDMGVLATERGYAIDNEGTVSDLFVDIAPELGLQCEVFSPDSDTLEQYLENDFVVICYAGPGDFTDTGHFFVITGINDDGELTINDPYSTVRSAKTWDIDTVVSQSKKFYAFKEA